MSAIDLLWFCSLIVATVVLLISSIPALQTWRHFFGEATIGILLAGLPFAAMSNLSLGLTGLLVLIQFWLVLCSCRLIIGRLQPTFLRFSTQQSSAVFLLAILVLLGVVYLRSYLPTGTFIFIIMSVATLAVGVLCLRTARAFKTYTIDQHEPSTSFLPTVSLCIPARNEDHALNDCLQAAIASDYPKLEILVLDDCSQDATSQLIRAFAHDGVQFIRGDEPAVGWLGRNQACATLAAQANGEYIIFMGVDTRLSETSITQLVTYMGQHKLRMLSVLAQRFDGVRGSTLFGGLRYFWQVVLPLSQKRVPISSQLWAIERKSLQDLGGFAAVRHKIIPEGSFARRLFARQEYRFLTSNKTLGIYTAKKWLSQMESGQRILYPTYKRQPYITLLFCLILASSLLAPAVLLAAVFIHQFGGLELLAAVSYLLSWLLYSLYLWHIIPTGRYVHMVLAIAVWPLLVMQEIILSIASMIQYEFGEVNWKGRNVCYPVIHPPKR